MKDHRDKPRPKGTDGERRRAPRFAVRDLRIDVQSGDSFLYAYVRNIGELGIFVATDEPLPVGSRLTLRFPARGNIGPLTLGGEVRWVNPATGRNPGMGIAFDPLSPDQREKLVALVRAVAYLADE